MNLVVDQQRLLHRVPGFSRWSLLRLQSANRDTRPFRDLGRLSSLRLLLTGETASKRARQI